MKKRIFENGIYYVLVGDYYVPELSLPNETYWKMGETPSGVSADDKSMRIQ